MKNLLAIILFFLAMGCSSVSKEKLEQQIKEDINTELTKRKRTVQVQSVKLVQKGEREYIGIAKIIEDEMEQSYDLNVVVDGDSYILDWRKSIQLPYE